MSPAEGGRPHTCGSCGAVLAADFRFCPSCGTPTVPPDSLAETELRPMAVLFCDLVDFSGLSHRLDGEVLQEVLREYHVLVRQQLDEYGGVVEKYIGDAVVGVFGYPEAHDDDVDRALLAASGALSAMAERNRSAAEPLQLRVGVHVGDAVVDLRANPATGQGFVAGRTINLAQRIQSVADPDTVAASDAVVHRSGGRFAFADRTSRHLKGEPGPVVTWRLAGSRQAPGEPFLPLIGRDAELRELLALVDATVRSQVGALAVVSGEAGAGKSRLVAELRHLLASSDDGPRWLRGRCLPYGSGVTFSALSRIFKQAAEILDTDQPDVVRSKVHGLLDGEPDGPWTASRLLPLLGVDAVTYAQSELFSAWAQALSSFARKHPTVVLIEDLHWADDGLVEFLEHVASSRVAGPVLVLLTARPNLFAQRPDWPPEAVRRLELGPLSAADTARVAAAELGSGSLPPMAVADLLDRAAGNPLFAREYARLVRSAQGSGSSPPDLTTLPVPVTINALLAARLDTLTLDERAVVQCAALIGKVVWSGAVADLAGIEPDQARRALDALTGQGVFRHSEHSVLAGDHQYVFSHVLLRDVAHSRAPRAWKRDAHLRAVSWMERCAGERVDEVAEVLVHHATAALDLADLTGDADAADRARQAARRYARIAGRRALALDPRRAVQMLDIARALTPGGDDDEGTVLLEWSAAALAVDRVHDAADARERAVEMLRVRDDPSLLASALIELGDARYQLGDVDAALAADREAAQLARALPVSADDPVANLALTLAAVGDFAGLAVADEAEHRARSFGLGTPLAALRARGMLQLQAGSSAGLADYEAALQRLVDEHAPVRAVASAMTARADAVWRVRGSVAGLAAYDEVIDFAGNHGVTNIAQWAAVNRLLPLLETGAVEPAMRAAEQAWGSTAHSRVRQDALDAWSQAVHELGTRALAEAVSLRLAEFAEPFRTDSSADTERAEIVAVAMLRLAVGRGDRDSARDWLQRVLVDGAQREAAAYDRHLTTFVRSALWLGEPGWAAVLATADRPGDTLRRDAQRTASAWLELDGGDVDSAARSFAACARRWGEVGHRIEHSYCLVGTAASLAARGDPQAAAARRDAERARTGLGLPWPLLSPVGAGSSRR